MTDPLPRLRAVDVTPLDPAGCGSFLLRDREAPDGEPLLLTQEGLLLASLLDGVRDAAAVQAAFTLRTATAISSAFVQSFILKLEDANLLESERYRKHRLEQLEIYRSAAVRLDIHAGRAYPAAPDELTAFLDSLFTHPEGPGERPGAPRRPPLRGLIAPHIDLHRGGPTYAWGYKALAESEPPELYVLLGTCHSEMSTPLAATRKAYATPLGAAAVDECFLDALESTYDGNLYEDELSHRFEHSLEFQAVFLRYLDRADGGMPAPVVPLLCGAFNQLVGGEPTPADSPAVGRALDALGNAMAKDGRRACILAAADLAHIGPQFGDPTPVTRGFLEQVARCDDEMLKVVCQADADGLYRQVVADGDSRRICGLAPMYYLLALLRPATGELLKYTQWIEDHGWGCVTFASVIFQGGEQPLQLRRNQPCVVHW